MPYLCHNYLFKCIYILGEEADLFSGALYNNYQAPDGFCFDVLCSDTPIIDGKHSPDNNVKEKVWFQDSYYRVF